MYVLNSRIHYKAFNGSSIAKKSHSLFTLKIMIWETMKHKGYFYFPVMRENWPLGSNGKSVQQELRTGNVHGELSGSSVLPPVSTKRFAWMDISILSMYLHLSDEKERHRH